MHDRIANAYNRVPYESACFPFTHPARMGAVARLHGVAAAAPQHGRVLEIGCAMGENLLPLALQYPDARFVGVDISEVHIARAKSAASALSISNVELRCGDIRDLTDSLDGPFDFIICHGVYSWVPPGVRESILGCCARHLAPHGVAMISFNALPGGCEFRRTRDLALRLSSYAGPTDALARLEQAKAALEKLLRDAHDLVDAPMQRAIQTLIEAPPSYAVHEYFSEYNEAFSLGSFAAQLGPHGLHYLADAQIDIDGARGRLAQRSGLATQRLSPLALEAALDAIEGTAFRRALVCRQPTDPARFPDMGALRSMAAACRFSDVTQPESGSPVTAPLTLQTPCGHSLRLLLPAAKDTARRLLREQPRYVEVASLLVDRSSAETEIVLRTLLHLALGGLIDLVTAPLAIAAALPDPPRLWPWAAYAVHSGAAMYCGTTHEPRETTAQMRLLSQAINGHRTIDELERLWTPSMQQGATPAPQDSPATKNKAAENPPLRSMLQSLHALGAIT